MKKTSLIILITILSALLFSACTMSASTPPPVTPTTNLSEIARQATETAIAKTPKAGETQVPEATEESMADPTATVSEAVEATNTPEPTADVEETEEPVVYEYAVPSSYTLKEGEFIYCIARRFNIHPEDLKSTMDMRKALSSILVTHCRSRRIADPGWAIVPCSSILMITPLSSVIRSTR